MEELCVIPPCGYYLLGLAFVLHSGCSDCLDDNFLLLLIRLSNVRFFETSDTGGDSGAAP